MPPAKRAGERLGTPPASPSGATVYHQHHRQPQAQPNAVKNGEQQSVGSCSVTPVASLCSFSRQMTAGAPRRRRQRARRDPPQAFPHRASHRCTVARARAATAASHHTYGTTRLSTRCGRGHRRGNVPPALALPHSSPAATAHPHRTKRVYGEVKSQVAAAVFLTHTPAGRRAPQPRTGVSYRGPPRVRARTVGGDVGGGAAAAAVATGRGVDGQTGERTWPSTRPGGAAPPLGTDCMVTPRRPSSAGGGVLVATRQPHVSRPVSMMGENQCLSAGPRPFAGNKYMWRSLEDRRAPSGTRGIRGSRRFPL